jgi:cell division septum initiation protein DivIVA
MAVLTEPAKTFSRVFWGYDRGAVDAHVEMLTAQQQLLRDDVESLMVRLKESGDEATALRKEVALLTETSPSPHAVQQRMAMMLRRAVDEISEMQAEAQAEADALITAAEDEIEADRRKQQELLADIAAQRNALETECDEVRKELDDELARLRSETDVAIDEAWQDAQQERERLVEQTRREVDDLSQRRIRILEQLMGVYRDLDAVPATLESAYQDLKDASETSRETAAVLPLDKKINAG